MAQATDTSWMYISLRAVQGQTRIDSDQLSCFCHGGAWGQGAKWQYAVLGAYLASRGYVTVLVSYSLYPQVEVQTMVAEI